MSTGRKIALITGASSGLGRSLASALASDGYDLFLVARTDLSAIASECAAKGVTAQTLAIDLSSAAACAQAVAACVKAFGRLDVLINNAGVLFENGASPERIDAMLAINLHAPIHLCEAALPHLKASSGVIVNIGSTSGLIVRQTQQAYGASKAGLNYYTKALRDSLRPFGIKVIMVNPGGMKTDLFKASPRSLAGHMEPAEVASLIAHALKTSAGVEVGELTINRMR